MAGYIARMAPLGLRKMGDRIDEKVLFITITMMGICTTLIGVLADVCANGVCASITRHCELYTGWAPGRKFPARVPCQ